ncbi:MAG: NUDIX domain-containing protein [Thermoleophilia bacterium]
MQSDLRVFRVRSDSAVSPRTGEEHDFVVLESMDWVAVVALTEDGRLVLVRQFRHGLREVTLELPGGLIDPGMTPEQAARAELRQETGYGGGEWTELGRLAPLPAVFTNQMHVFLARGVRLQGDPEPDPAEDIAIELVLVEDARGMVARGEIVHAPMVGALFLWELSTGIGGAQPVAAQAADAPSPGVPPPTPAVAESAPATSADIDQRPGEGEAAGSLRARVMEQLRSHFTVSVATVGPVGVDAEPGSPHAATVFYALDRRGRLVFLSKGDSRHGRHIGSGAPVAATVAREYSDWREIQGVQLWGRVEPLHGIARAHALVVYVARFPFVSALLEDPRLAARLRGLEVYRITPRRAALTDNRLGPFGREVLEDL